jgi:hypothetical protein
MNRNHLLGGQTKTDFESEIEYLRKLAYHVSVTHVDIATYNLERVRAYYEDHPGCMQKHACRALNLTKRQVETAVNKLRAEWRNK